MDARPLVLIAGPTGSGKSRLALTLARRSGGEVVNYDSVQLYRGFDIGSAKVTGDERRVVPHHLLDVLEATDEFSAADYQRAADRVIADLHRRDTLPVFVGGTFFYLRALLHGLPDLPPADPEVRGRLKALWEHERGRARLHRLLERVDPITHMRLAPADRQRRERALEVWLLTRRPLSSWERPTAGSAVRHRSLMVALELERGVLIQRLDRRVIEMYDGGLLEETASLLSRYPATARPFTSIGYAEAVRHLRGELTRHEAIEETQRRTRAYAKRQMTWLRAERDVLWIHASASHEAMAEMIEETVQRRLKLR